MPKAASTTMKKTVKAKAKAPAKKAAAPAVKPVKNVLSKSELVRHLAEQGGTDTKAVKAVLGALESTLLGAVHKSGARLFVLPGLFKVTAQAVPAAPTPSIGDCSASSATSNLLTGSASSRPATRAST